MAAIHTISKKSFKTDCDLTHSFGRGRKKINAIYFNWRETPKGRGVKYAVATSVENYTKAELFNYFYDWVCNSIALPNYIFYRCANEDKDRFKYPIIFDRNQWS